MEIREILSDLGYQLRDYGNQYRTKPLYRSSGNNTSLVIDKRTGNWYDFSAQLGGGLKDLVDITLGLNNKKDATEWLKNRQYTPLKKTEQKPLVKSGKLFPKETLKELMPIHDYWINRGITKETIKIFQGGFCDAGQLRNRYVFPILNCRKEIVGFSGRDTTNFSKIKWKHLGQTDTWCYPTFFNLPFVWQHKQIILIESIGDMLKLWDAGIKNTMVLFGTALGKKRFSFLLKAFPKSIVIALNNDSDENNKVGQRASNKIYKVLNKYFDSDILSIYLPTKKDFGEMNIDEIKDWYKQANGKA